MNGIFYGIGVGPGDPELMTLKAVRIIRQCQVTAIPVSDSSLDKVIYEEEGTSSRFPEYLKKCAAYQIAQAAVPELEEKGRLYLPMPMIKDKSRLKEIHDLCAAKTKELLDTGKSVSFITLGDPSIYSTCLYVHQRLKKLGCTTKLVPGIPSFCAAAAKLDMGLVENSDELHVIPASYEIEESLELPGTKVLMKAGKKMPYVKRTVQEKGLRAEMVENCGMRSERIYHSVEDVPEEAGYYSLMIVKEGK